MHDLALLRLSDGPRAAASLLTSRLTSRAMSEQPRLYGPTIQMVGLGWQPAATDMRIPGRNHLDLLQKCA
jgi:hypothetical protein